MPASASYWAFSFDAWGAVTQWMWNCEACDAMGLEPTEAEAVRKMNAHMGKAIGKAKHKGYTAPPIPA